MSAKRPQRALRLAAWSSVLCATSLAWASPTVGLQPLWRLPLVREGLARTVVESQATPALDEAGGIAICGTGEGRVVAVGLRDGQVRWRFAHAFPFASAATLGTLPDGRAAVALGGQNGTLLLLDAASGHLRWQTDLEGEARAAPLHADGDYFVTTARNRLLRVGGADGAVRWSNGRAEPLGMTVLGHAGATRLGERVFTSFSDGFAAAMDANSGQFLWQRPLSLSGGRFRDADATPVAVGDAVVFASLSDGVYALDPRDGATVWQQPLANIAHLAVASASGQAALFVGDADGVIYALSAQSGRILWRRPLLREPVRAVYAQGDTLFVLSGEQGLQMLSAADGRLQDSVGLGGRPGGEWVVGKRWATHLSSQGALLVWRLTAGAGR